MNVWRVAALAVALGAGACRTVRIQAPVDLGSYAGRLPASKQIQTLAPIVRLRVPEAWTTQSPLDMGNGVINDGKIREQSDGPDLPVPELLVRDPAHQFGGGIYFPRKADGMDIDRIRKHEVHDGFARYVEDPSLCRTRIDERDGFILRGGIDLWNSDLAAVAPGVNRRQGDVVMAIVPLRNLGATVVIIVVSPPGVLSRDPGPAFAIFNTVRFREPKLPGAP